MKNKKIPIICEKGLCEWILTTLLIVVLAVTTSNISIFKYLIIIFKKEIKRNGLICMKGTINQKIYIYIKTNHINATLKK